MGGGRREQSSSKVIEEDLNVWVNTLILCKLLHKQRTSCCAPEADKHGSFKWVCFSTKAEMNSDFIQSLNLLGK